MNKIKTLAVAAALLGAGWTLSVAPASANKKMSVEEHVKELKDKLKLTPDQETRVREAVQKKDQGRNRNAGSPREDPLRAERRSAREVQRHGRQEREGNEGLSCGLAFKATLNKKWEAAKPLPIFFRMERI